VNAAAIGGSALGDLMRTAADDAIILHELEKVLGIESPVAQPVTNVVTLDTLKRRLPEYEIALPDLSELNTLPDFAEDLLPNWLPADVFVMLGVGFVSALISSSLREPFDRMHDRWSKVYFEDGGHAGQSIDATEHIQKYGARLHRPGHGHDILNPFEVNWGDYFSEGSQAGLATKLRAWLRHLAQDCFSRQGLPLPGSSYIRGIIETILKGSKTWLGVSQFDLYEAAGTLKARDFVGMTAAPLLIKIYVLGTEFDNKKRFMNYRYLSLSLGALVSSLAFGLMMHHPSLNYPALTAAIPYAVALWKLDHKLGRLLAERQKVLDANADLVTADSRSLMLAADSQLETDSRLSAFWDELSSVHDMTSSALQGLLDDIESTLRNEEIDLLALEGILNLGGV